MAGRNSTIQDSYGESRKKFEASLEFGTHDFVGQLAYARDPARVLYDRQQAMRRSTIERGRKKIPMRGQNIE
jgi:hypothetical protein